MQFHFLPSANPSDPKPAQLAEIFLRLMKDESSPLYNGAASHYIDASVAPIVSSKVVDPSSDSGDNRTRNIAIAIGVSVVAIVLICVGVCYVRRKAITDWLLWKLGNFRFNRFTEHEQAGPGAINSEMEDPRLNKPAPLASSASGADTLTLAEPDDRSPVASGTGGAGGAAHSESAKLTLSSESERAAPANAGVGHESFDTMPIIRSVWVVSCPLLFFFRILSCLDGGCVNVLRVFFSPANDL